MGFGTVIPSDELLQAVYVHPKVARIGVGSAIYAALEREAIGAGVNCLTTVTSVNAFEFYKKRGFVEESREDHALSTGGKMSCVHMKKILK